MKAENSSFIPHPSSFTVVSHSAAQTRAWGRKLGRLLKGGEIIGLSGELGSGKTCFARGVAEGAGVGKEAWIRSPTFTLINEYDGRLPVYHVDLYRIGNARELEELNLREYLFSDGASVVEWFEHLPAGEIDEWLQIDFTHAGGSRRGLTFAAHGRQYVEIIEALRVKLRQF
jgi:tRNA threonylcarbamoyladenosine biosynthesis protein TsaE